MNAKSDAKVCKQYDPLVICALQHAVIICLAIAADTLKVQCCWQSVSSPSSASGKCAHPDLIYTGIVCGLLSLGEMETTLVLIMSTQLTLQAAGWQHINISRVTRITLTFKNLVLLAMIYHNTC